MPRGSQSNPVDGRPRGAWAGLYRRAYLTYKYHGLGSLLLRVVLLPLRFTPWRRYARLTRDRSSRARALAWYRAHAAPVSIVIPSYRDADAGQRARGQHPGARPIAGRVRIIVADDASGPEHLAALRAIDGVESSRPRPTPASPPTSTAASAPPTPITTSWCSTPT